jgi:hypothetical protein
VVQVQRQSVGGDENTPAYAWCSLRMLGSNRNDGEPTTWTHQKGSATKMGQPLGAKDVGKEKVQTRKLGVGPGHIGTPI